MTDFARILDAARARNGGEAALNERLPVVASADELRAITDDRYLSRMSMRVFSAGLRYSMVEAKWPAFEEVFHGFVPQAVRAMNDEELEALMGDARIIRHWGKIKSVRANAAAMCEVIDEAGSFGNWLADWPSDHIVELWDVLAKRFSQLGGNSGPYFLRWVGKDTFMANPYVLKALDHWGLHSGTGKGKRQRAQLQDVFNRLHDETGLPLCQISMILAQSID